jgi:HD-like signal output (HDOD) protein
MLSTFQQKWGVEQWVAFLKDKEIPVLPRTRQTLLTFSEERQETVAPKELANIVFSDPYLALKLLRRAEGHRSSTLGHETTTALATVLQTGLDAMLRTVNTSVLASDLLQGQNNCEWEAVLAANIARRWAAARADISAEEVAMAALLGESGELLLWHFAPELPQHALAELHAGRAQRTMQAQQQTCGFSFKVLTMALTEAWQLPHLIVLLIKGADNLRANIARLATDTARHIVTDPENPAIPADIAAMAELLPGISHAQLISALPISPQYAERVLEQLASGDVSQSPEDAS